MKNSFFVYAINPLHWPQILVAAIVMSWIQLPRFMMWPIKPLLSLSFRIAFKSRAKVICKNIEICFPQKSKQERHAIENGFYRDTVTVISDTMYTYYSRLFNRIPYQVKGLEHVKAAIAAKKPILLTTVHFSTTFIAAKFIVDSLHQPIANVFRPQTHTLVNLFYKRKQNQLFIPIKKNNSRKIISILQQQHPVIYLFDLNDSQGRTFIPVFGTLASTRLALCKIARIADACVIPFHCTRDKNGIYQLQFESALTDFPSGDDAADLTRVSQLFEPVIAQYPEQYLWTHRRFKTRPNQAPDYY